MNEPTAKTSGTSENCRMEVLYHTLQSSINREYATHAIMEGIRMGPHGLGQKLFQTACFENVADQSVGIQYAWQNWNSIKKGDEKQYFWFPKNNNNKLSFGRNKAFLIIWFYHFGGLTNSRVGLQAGPVGCSIVVDSAFPSICKCYIFVLATHILLLNSPSGSHGIPIDYLVKQANHCGFQPC